MIELNREQIIKAWEDEVALGKDIGLKRDFINYVSISLVNATLSLINELTEENERLRASSIDYRNIPIITEEARADTARKMSALLNAQIDEITRSRIELRAFPFAALLAERMKVIVADTAKKVEEGKA